MILYINTVSHDEIIIALRSGVKIIAQKKISAPRQQAEKLIPAIDRLLREKKIKLSALKKIVVANRGGSFTALRIGVITANALAYALKIPVMAESKGNKALKKFAAYAIVEPVYDREPTIGRSKKSYF
jgi:tRNA threonylcarbamoyl adenosine modification protein YeaZ